MNKFIKREDILTYVDKQIRNILQRPLMYCHSMESLYDTFVMLINIRHEAIVNSFDEALSYNCELMPIMNTKARKLFKANSRATIPHHLAKLGREDELPGFLLEVYEELIAEKISLPKKMSESELEEADKQRKEAYKELYNSALDAFNWLRVKCNNEYTLTMSHNSYEGFVFDIERNVGSSNPNEWLEDKLESAKIPNIFMINLSNETDSKNENTYKCVFSDFSFRYV